MTKNKVTKRSLLSSGLALLLCISMLIGSTFAWFTDKVESGKNTIVAGNLDVELYYQNDETSDWTKVDANSNIFKEDTLWEPGHTEVIKLKVANEGTLALKYQFAVNVVKETTGINQANQVFKLSDHIKFDIIEGELADDADRADAVDAIDATAKPLSSGASRSNHLLEKEENIVTMIVYMPEIVGNEANYKTGTAAPTIDLGLHLFATQYTYEKDSFDELYDKSAYWTGDADTTWYDPAAKEFTLTTAEQLAGFAQIVNTGKDTFAGKTVKLGADIDLYMAAWTPIGNNDNNWNNKFNGTFIGTGYTISNLCVTGTDGVGLFGFVGSAAHIEGVTIEKAYVSGNNYVGAVVGHAYLAVNCLKNCTVSNATVIAAPSKLPNGQFDGGAKAGVIAGYALNGNVTGNKAIKSSVSAYRDLGGIVGMLSTDGGAVGNIVASGNAVDEVTLSYVGVPGAYFEGKVNSNMSEVVGRVGAKSSVGENTVTNVTMNDVNAGVAMIFSLEDLLDFTKEVNAGNAYSEKTVLLGDDIDLNNMEWTPIGTTDAGFKGIFDGQGHTISNLKITGNKSKVGLFANTYNGEIKNLTVENASVSGYTSVGVVAGNPYTSKYTNITVKGHVEVNGLSYVGGVGGKNVYADWTNITVDVDDTSYVKAISTENGKHWHTYVGGVAGFMGEGSHTMKNVTSNIDVTGDVSDIGGIVGIAHYNNKFENITCTGDVTGTFFDPECPSDAEEVGGIAGVWHNKNDTTVTFIDCKFTGKLTPPADAVDVDFSDNTIVGNAYSTTGTGILRIYNNTEVEGVTYCTEQITGEKVLTKVSADAPANLVIPEGVTAMSSGAFASTHVQTVTVPATVTDFGGTPNADGTGASGGAFKNSAVEKVILPEGMTEIPAAAFNGAKNLKEVTIPASVKSVGINAFAYTAMTSELVIPATVTEIGYGAFRGVTDVTTVIIEGNPVIANYAFRSCPNLTEVKILGANVTFTGTSQTFCRADNAQDMDQITICVANEKVAERLAAAQGSAKGYNVVCEQEKQTGGYYADEQGNATAYDAGALNAAINSDDIKNIVLADDVQYSTTIKNDAKIDLSGNTFEATNTIKLDSNADLTMTGGDYVVNSTYGHVDVRPTTTEGSEVVFEDVDFSFNKKSPTYGPSTNRLGSVVEVCANVSDAHTKITFRNCTFDNAQVVFEGQSGKTGSFEAVFENCTFNALTSSAPIYVQNYVRGTIEVTGCTFNLECTSSSASAISVSSSTSTAVTVNAKDNTINATAATPYTYDASKGETEVDNIKVNGTPANIKFISIGGTTSSATETGTVKIGIAK